MSTGSPSDAAVSPDGNTAFVATARFANGRYDFGVVGLDTTNGALRWNLTWGGSAGSDDLAQALALAPSGATLVVAGNSANRNVSFSDPPLGMDLAVIGVDAVTGSLQWSARYNGAANGEEMARDVVMNLDGTRAFVVGRTQVGSDWFRAHDGVIVAYDTATGAQLWASTVAGSRGEQDELFAVGVSADGARVYAAGSVDNVGTGRDMVVIAFDATTGARLWTATYAGTASAQDQAAALAVVGSHVVVTGMSGNDFATVAFHSTDGTRAWVSRIASSWGGVAIVPSADGARVFVAGSVSTPSGWTQMLTAAYATATGAKLWQAQDDGHYSWANRVAVDALGQRVYTVGQLQTEDYWSYARLTAYDAASGARAWRQDTMDASQAQVAISPDSARALVAGGVGARLRVAAYATGVEAERHGISMTPASQNSTFGPVGTAEAHYPVDLRNTGNQPETVTLGLSLAASGWTSSLLRDGQAVTSVQLAPGANVTLMVVVRSNLTTLQGGTWANVTAVAGPVSAHASTWTSKEAGLPVQAPATPRLPCMFGPIVLPDAWCSLFG